MQVFEIEEVIGKSLADVICPWKLIASRRIRVIQIAAFWLFIAPQAFSGSIWLDFDENAKIIQFG